GHTLTVWNRTARRAKPLVDAGARRAASPAALFEACDLVIVITIDDKSARAVYEGKGGLLSAPLRGKLVVEMSTLTPDTNKRLEGLVRGAGGLFLECPVGGSVAPARQGNLLGMAGGTPAAWKRAQPVLEQLCRKVERLGPVGAGSTMKLAVNLPLLTYFEALGEAISLSESAGIKRAQAAEFLAESSGAAKVAGPRIPGVMDAVAGKPPKAVSFDIAGAAKDATLMVATARKAGFHLPAIDAARKSLAEAAKSPWGARDFSLLAAWRVLQSRKAGRE
ncbi:MAG: NAD(P)-dependent oxidoreductase, partial [Alphaproteobacteria bacterium]